MTIEYKDYKKWMDVKSVLQAGAVKASSTIGYREGDIFWMCIGENVGYEEDGKGEQYLRPVLVLAGISKTLFLGAPLSLILKKGRFYYQITVRNRINTVMFNQVRVFDTARIFNKGRMGHLDRSSLLGLKRVFREMI